MRALVQRVSRASVLVDGEVRGTIGEGFVVLLGVGHDDDEGICDAIARKVVGLRVFEDDDGKMNRSLAETGGAILCVSQFTLYGSTRKGNRPSFTAAAVPEVAERLYERFCAAVRSAGVRCETGVFGSDMAVELSNDGPVTIWIDSADLQRPRNA